MVKSRRSKGVPVMTGNLRLGVASLAISVVFFATLMALMHPDKDMAAEFFRAAGFMTLYLVAVGAGLFGIVSLVIYIAVERKW